MSDNQQAFHQRAGKMLRHKAGVYDAIMAIADGGRIAIAGLQETRIVTVEIRKPKEPLLIIDEFASVTQEQLDSLK